MFSTSYSYDALGEMLSAANGSASYSYTYDALGQVTSSTATIAGLSASVTLGYQYNTVGQRTQLSASIDGTADLVNSYSYNGLGQLTSLVQQGVTGGNAVAEKRVDFSYNAVGQFDTITRYADLGGGALVASSSYGYDASNRLTSLVHTQGGTTLAGYTLAYDAADRLAQQTSTADGTVNYSYDATGQLTSASPLPRNKTGSGVFVLDKGIVTRPWVGISRRIAAAQQDHDSKLTQLDNVQRMAHAQADGARCWNTSMRSSSD